ncbi:MAG: GTPase [Butyricicoccaceae bacterium]
MSSTISVCGEPFGISALHGYGVGELLDAAYEHFPAADEEEEDDERIRVALIGKPKVGKSSLLNRVLGEERVIVSNVAGTTRDSVDADVDNAHGKFTFIDTAGITQRARWTREDREVLGHAFAARGRACGRLRHHDRRDRGRHRAGHQGRR